MKTPNDLLSILASHIGKDNGMPVAVLAKLLDITERQVRELVTELRMDGTAVCGTPKTGYYIAANPEELAETCEFLRGRALKSLTLESRLRNISLPDLLGQIHLPT